MSESPQQKRRTVGIFNSRRCEPANVACYAIGLCVLTWWLWTQLVPDLRLNTSYVESVGEIIDKDLKEFATDAGPLYGCKFLIRFPVNGQGRSIETWVAYRATFQTTGDRSREERIFNLFVVGQKYPCWYDPDNPEHAALTLGYNLVAHSEFAVIMAILFLFPTVLPWLRKEKGLDESQ
jgi:hypothetical protein